LKFEIEVANPQVVIPRSAKSGGVIIADLGHISAFNDFRLIEDSSKKVKIESFVFFSPLIQKQKQN